MSDETVNELAACLTYARTVARVLPVNDEADAMAEAVLARALAAMPRRPPRKLGRKAQP